MAGQHRVTRQYPADSDSQERVAGAAPAAPTFAIDVARALFRDLARALRALDEDERDEVLGELYLELADPAV